MARQPGFLKRGEPVRLQAFLARSGIASRRAAEEMITHGRIAVNGETVTAMGLTVVPGVDRVEVDGEEVKVAPTTWLALHKPKGYVTTRIDPYGRRTVYDLLPEKYHGLFHVGRLDRDSEGLLLLTNDGELANRFLHPSYGITKEYDVVATGKPTDAALRQLMEGVELDDGAMAQAESAKLMGPAGNGLSRLKLVLREGKKREVRRMLAALGHEVTRLVRRRFGPIELGELPKGKYRIVQPEELSHVREPSKKTKARDTHGAYEAEEKPRARAGAKAGPARTRPAADGDKRPRARAADERKPARGAARSGAGSRFAEGEATPKRAGARAGTRLGTGTRFGEEQGKKRRVGQEKRGRPADLNVPPKRPRDDARSLNEWDDERPAAPSRSSRGTNEWDDAPRRPVDRAARPGTRARPDREFEDRAARAGRAARDEWDDADDRAPRARTGGGVERGGRTGARAGGTRSGGTRGGSGADRGPRGGGERGGSRGARPARGEWADADEPRGSRSGGAHSGGTRGGVGADRGPRGGGERGGSRGGRPARDGWGDADEPRGSRSGGARGGGTRGGRHGAEERGGGARGGGSRGGRSGAEERGGSRGGRFGDEERGGSRGGRPSATRTPAFVDENDRDELDEWSTAPRRPRAGGGARGGGGRGDRAGGGARGGARGDRVGGGARGGGARGDRTGGGARDGARTGGASRTGDGGRPGGARGGGGRPGAGGRSGGGRPGGGRAGGGRSGGPRRGGGGGGRRG